MRGIAVVCALLGAVGVARAADLPVAPAVAPARVVAAPVTYDWTGFYVGVNGGWAFSHISDTATITGGPLSGLSGTASATSNAALAGGQVGFNWQSNWAVFGIEGDFDWFNSTSSGAIGALSYSTKEPWIATIRGRGGFALDRVLFYGTAGAAFVEEQHTENIAGFGQVFNASQVDLGWTIGAGVESAFAQNWTARVEYLFIDEKLSLSGPLTGSGGNLSYSGTIERSIVRGGINYKFQ